MSELVKATTAKATLAKANATDKGTVLKTFLSRKRPARNNDPRGNARIVAAAVSIGFPLLREGRVCSENYLNPNEEGRPGVFPYFADILGCPILAVRYNDGSEKAVFANIDDANFFRDKFSKVADNSPANVTERTLSDYRKAVAKAKG